MPGFRETFPDLTVDVDAVHVSDDGSVVTVHTTFTGTQEGNFLDVPATGEAIGSRTADVHELHGKFEIAIREGKEHSCHTSGTLLPRPSCTLAGDPAPY